MLSPQRLLRLVVQPRSAALIGQVKRFITTQQPRDTDDTEPSTEDNSASARGRRSDHDAHTDRSFPSSSSTSSSHHFQPDTLERLADLLRKQASDGGRGIPEADEGEAASVYDRRETSPQVFEIDDTLLSTAGLKDSVHESAGGGIPTFVIDAERGFHKPERETAPPRQPIDPTKSAEELMREVEESIGAFEPVGADAGDTSTSTAGVHLDTLADAEALPTEHFRAADEEQEQSLAAAEDDKTTDAAEREEEAVSSGDEEDDYLTPAQRFYRENKERLLERAQQYYSDKHQQVMDENEWTFYRDPVVRPPKGHLWDFGDIAKVVPREDIHFEKGRMPTVEQVIKILEQEQVQDIVVIDLEECGRRDLGLYAIVATGQTPRHCRRAARLVSKTIKDLDVPYISAVSYSWGSDTDEWNVAHCGPLKVHILSKEWRQSYNLENLWLRPHEHFTAEDFPTYMEDIPGTPPPWIHSPPRNNKANAPVTEVFEQRYIEFTNPNDYRDPTLPIHLSIGPPTLSDDRGHGHDIDAERQPLPESGDGDGDGDEQEMRSSRLVRDAPEAEMDLYGVAGGEDEAASPVRYIRAAGRADAESSDFRPLDAPAPTTPPQPWSSYRGIGMAPSPARMRNRVAPPQGGPEIPEEIKGLVEGMDDYGRVSKKGDE
ncbi:unnamed protein product [Vitrella brassicaformis CCMP3155]|uniref:Ribosomal silencing factor RsfS n=3 Tax=Vitrella brassicaformis TaxID=1169539 RepID=A0A0G4GXV7_VITBC|nr:unnamed protein product [Vitrella brassicaformis CCMP3155]|eukprot:CEM35940.1 unnamed protein product [Vitrella brassicaformis CCMP3155]